MSLTKIFSFKIPEASVLPGLLTSFLESELSHILSLSVLFVADTTSAQGLPPSQMTGYYLVTFAPTLYGVTDIVEKSLTDGQLKGFSKFTLGVSE
jgi:hypothetical protein